MIFGKGEAGGCASRGVGDAHPLTAAKVPRFESGQEDEFWALAKRCGIWYNTHL